MSSSTIGSSKTHVNFPTQDKITSYLQKDDVRSINPNLTQKIIDVMAEAFARDYITPLKIAQRVTLQLHKLKDPTLPPSSETFKQLKTDLVTILVRCANDTYVPDPELEGLDPEEAASKWIEKNSKPIKKFDPVSTTTTTTSSESSTTDTTSTTATVTATATSTTTTASETSTAQPATAEEVRALEEAVERAHAAEAATSLTPEIVEPLSTTATATEKITEPLTTSTSTPPSPLQDSLKDSPTPPTTSLTETVTPESERVFTDLVVVENVPYDVEHFDFTRSPFDSAYQDAFTAALKRRGVGSRYLS